MWCPARVPRVSCAPRLAAITVFHTPHCTSTVFVYRTRGVVLDAHYVFQVCAPSRASFLTGRYPWGIGFYYVGGDNLGVPLQYEMLPQQLRRLAKKQTGADVATHAIVCNYARAAAVLPLC